MELGDREQNVDLLMKELSENVPWSSSRITQRCTPGHSSPGHSQASQAHLGDLLPSLLHDRGKTRAQVHRRQEDLEEKKKGAELVNKGWTGPRSVCLWVSLYLDTHHISPQQQYSQLLQEEV